LAPILCFVIPSSVIYHNAHISADGTKIVYRNEPNPTRWFKISEIMLYDTALMTSTRIGTTTSIINPALYGLSISADGTKVAFEYDTDLPPNSSEIWLYDVTTMSYTHKITNANNERSENPSLNADGTKIAFISKSDFFGQGSNDYEVWLYDTILMTYTRITTASDIGRNSWFPSVNDDGTKITFASDSDILGQGIVDGQYEIWLYDTTTMSYTRITTASSTDRKSKLPDISGDGTKIVFGSDSDFLGQGIDGGQQEIWLYDTTTMTLTRVTTSTENSTRWVSHEYRISRDGTRIVFGSDSDFLNEGIVNGQFEIWVYDIIEKNLSRITTVMDNPCTTYLPLIIKSGS
jgi:Tol biopolymer transport system component